MKIKLEDYKVDNAYSSLYDHWDSFYQYIRNYCQNPRIKYKENGSKCIYTGIDFPFLNAVYSTDAELENIDTHIADNIEFFKGSPFAWYVNENEVKLEKKLQEFGFTTPGSFYGMSGSKKSNKSISDKNINVELVKNEEMLNVFQEIIKESFVFSDVVAHDYRSLMSDLQWQGKIKNYIAYYKGMPCATLSTVERANTLSFWNGATREEFRRNGLCSFMAQNIMHLDCNANISTYLTYLMSDAMAMWICKNFGLNRQWSFKPYIYVA